MESLLSKAVGMEGAVFWGFSSLLCFFWLTLIGDFDPNACSLGLAALAAVQRARRPRCSRSSCQVRELGGKSGREHLSLPRCGVVPLPFASPPAKVLSCFC